MYICRSWFSPRIFLPGFRLRKMLKIVSYQTLSSNLVGEEVFVAGEALPLSTCQSWMKKWPHVLWPKRVGLGKKLRG